MAASLSVARYCQTAVDFPSDITPAILGIHNLKKKNFGEAHKLISVVRDILTVEKRNVFDFSSRYTGKENCAVEVVLSAQMCEVNE